jgi:hypothetical protein
LRRLQKLRTTARITGKAHRHFWQGNQGEEDDENAVAPVAVLAEQLGFAPIALGPLKDGGSLVQATGNTRGKLIFKDLVKFK